MGAGRLAETAAWAVAGAAGAVALTQAAGRTPTPLAAVGQALTPALAAATLPALGIGIVRGRGGLVGLAAAGGCGLAAVIAPAIRRSRPGAVRAVAASTLSIAHANLLFTNERRAGDAARHLFGLGADVLALSEFTHHHARVLASTAGAERYVHRFSEPHEGPQGIAVWSTVPLHDVVTQPLTRRPGVVAEVGAPWGRVRLVLAHPDPPTEWRWLVNWDPSLRMIHAVASAPGPPTVIVADLNACRWHPPLRQLLARGWRDAHEQAGRGLSVSWPVGRLVRPFVRLDHALIGAELDVVAVTDSNVPGSDHRGFMVTVAPTSTKA